MERLQPTHRVGDAMVIDMPAAAPAREAPQRRKRKGASRRERQVAQDELIELSAAQTRQVWRGTQPTLGAREVDFAGAGESRSLSAAEINTVVRRDSRAVLDCIERARGNAVLEATVMLEMLVDGTGAVQQVRVGAPAYLFEHGFEACAQRAARAMRFPATGAETIVSAPLELY